MAKKLTPAQRMTLEYLNANPNVNRLMFARRGLGQCYYFESYLKKRIVARRTWDWLCEQGYLRRTMNGSDFMITDDGVRALDTRADDGGGERPS